MTEGVSLVQQESIDLRQAVRLGGAPRRVLHVEDDAFVAALVAATVEDAGVDVRWCSTGRSALTAAATRAYDAFLLGIGPRDMSRILLAEGLAQIDDGIPIILITDGAESLPLGPNVRVVTRPFEPHALVGAIEAALGAYREAA